MATFNNLAAIEPWMFRSTITDSWYPESFARETESVLTKALQQSFFNTQQLSQINHPISPSFSIQQSDYLSTTPSASTVTVTATASGSGSEPDTPGSKRRGFNTSLGVSVGKPAKRKSRASKRSMTTFIQADPANFRQMVQQVTGVKLEGNGQLPVSSTVVKPEPMRQPFVNKLHGLLPTLDTSAYLLQHQENSVHRIPVSSTATGFSQLPAVNQMTDDGVDFYSFSSFPTLESSF